MHPVESVTLTSNGSVGVEVTVLDQNGDRLFNVSRIEIVIEPERLLSARVLFLEAGDSSEEVPLILEGLRVPVEGSCTYDLRLLACVDHPECLEVRRLQGEIDSLRSELGRMRREVEEWEIGTLESESTG